MKGGKERREGKKEDTGNWENGQPSRHFDELFLVISEARSLPGGREAAFQRATG